MDEIDRALIVATQGGLPLVARPYHAIGEQLRALIGGGEWLGHGQEPHRTEDARNRLSAKAWNH